MDKYGDAIYLTPMVFGGLASMFAAAWRFLGVRSGETIQTTLDTLCGLPGRIRKIDNEADLAVIEDEVDAVMRAERLKSAQQDEGASDTTAMIAAGHRIDNLIHHRRVLLLATKA